MLIFYNDHFGKYKYLLLFLSVWGKKMEEKSRFEMCNKDLKRFNEIMNYEISFIKRE